MTDEEIYLRWAKTRSSDDKLARLLLALAVERDALRAELAEVQTDADDIGGSHNTLIARWSQEKQRANRAEAALQRATGLLQAAATEIRPPSFDNPNWAVQWDTWKAKRDALLAAIAEIAP